MIVISRADFQGQSGIQLLWQNLGRWDDVAIVFPHLIAIVKSRTKLPESVLSWKQNTMGMEIVVTLHKAGRQKEKNTHEDISSNRRPIFLV